MAQMKRRALIVGGTTLSLLAVAGGLWYSRGGSGEFVSESVSRGPLEQIVSVTGAVESDAAMELRFGSAGTVESILALVGQRYEAGAELLSLDTAKLDAEVKRTLALVQAAQADLNLKVAGPSQEEEAVSLAKVKQAEIQLATAEDELSNTLLSNAESLRKAELELANAELSLENAELDYDNALESQVTSGSQSDADVNAAYEDAQPNLQGAFDDVNDALSNVDLLIGEDEDALNAQFDVLFPSNAGTPGAQTRELYNEASVEVLSLENSFDFLLSTWTSNEVDALLDDTETLLETSLLMVDLAYEGLDEMEVPLTGNLTSDINSLMSDLAGDRTALRSSLSSIQGDIQAVSNAKLGLSSSGLSSEDSVNAAYSALNQAQNNLSIAESNLESARVNAVLAESSAENTVDLRRSQLAQAEAQHEDLIAAPREVELASVRASILQAQASYERALSERDDAVITAPTTGVLVDLLFDEGEQVSSTEVAASFITEQLQVSANVSETDVAKVSVGDPVEMTLDAFSIQETFSGKVVSLNPAETVIQGVVYYEATVVFEEVDPRIKPGMTVNLDIVTDTREEALQIPAAAIQYEEEGTFVWVLDGEERERRDVILGLEGDRMVEVLEGLSEDETVVLYALD